MNSHKFYVEAYDQDSKQVSGTANGQAVLYCKSPTRKDHVILLRSQGKGGSSTKVKFWLILPADARLNYDAADPYAADSLPKKCLRIDNKQFKYVVAIATKPKPRLTTRPTKIVKALAVKREDTNHG